MINFLKKNFLGNALARNSAVLLMGTLGANFLNYIFHLVIGRMVSVEIYGETESLISLISIISVPATTLIMAAAKYASVCKAENDKGGSVEIWKYFNKKILKFGLLLFIIAIILTPYVAKFLNIQDKVALIIIWFMMLLSFFTSVNTGLLRGWQKFKAVSWMGILGTFAKLVFAVIIVKIGFGLNGIVGSFMLGAIITYIVSSIALKFIVIGKVEKQGECQSSVDIKSLKKYLMPVFAGNLAIVILGNASMVLAKHNLDSTSAGQFGALLVVSKVILFATGVISTALFSMSAEKHHKKTDTMGIFKNASFFMLALSLGAVIFYFLFPGFVLSLLFGKKYISVAGYLGWFAVMISLYSYLNLMFQYLLSIGKNKIAYILLIISLVSSGALLFIGKDIYAILWIMVISQLAGIIAGLYFIFKRKISIYPVRNKEANFSDSI